MNATHKLCKRKLQYSKKPRCLLLIGSAIIKMNVSHNLSQDLAFPGSHSFSKVLIALPQTKWVTHCMLSVSFQFIPTFNQQPLFETEQFVEKNKWKVWQTKSCISVYFKDSYSLRLHPLKILICLMGDNGNCICATCLIVPFVLF